MRVLAIYLNFTSQIGRFFELVIQEINAKTVMFEQY